jgi:hypothetical protein
MIRSAFCFVAAVTAAIACDGAPSAQALTMKECSAKYQAAQQTGSLNGMKWNDFRKTECGSAAQQATAPSAATPAGATPSGATSTRPAAAQKQMPAPAGNAVFPAAVSPKYSSESPGKARMHTCLDQYHANKNGNSNGSLKWIQKGGGYYAECNKRLKG